VNTSIQNLFSLEGKVAVVTGAGGYFGKAFSECLLSAGAKIVMLGRGSKIDEQFRGLVGQYGGNQVSYYSVDLYDDIAYRACLEEITANCATVDILVNNAFDFSKATGFNDPSGRVENISKEQWMRCMESGVYWYVLSTQVIGEKMKMQRSGSIINLSTMYASVAPDPNLYMGVNIFNPPGYSAAKAAVLAFTRYTASFYGEYNIRCNAILPGAFPNVSSDSYNSPKDDGFIKRLSQRSVLGRTGILDDLKGVLILLASEASSYITGQGIAVDGGWTIR